MSVLVPTFFGNGNWPIWWVPPTGWARRGQAAGSWRQKGRFFRHLDQGLPVTPSVIWSVTRPQQPARSYDGLVWFPCRVHSASSRSSVSAMASAQMLPFSISARSSSGAREQS